MTVTDQIKISDRKVKQNEAQCDLDRKVAKISALSSRNLDKYEYVTGKDLELKTTVIEQARFEFSLLGRVFNKGMNKEEKKEEIFKRLKNFEEKSGKQLKAIEDQGKKVNIISQYKIKPPLLKSIYSQDMKNGRIDNGEAKKVFKILEDMEGSEIDYSKLVYKSGYNKYFDFARFGSLSSSFLRWMNSRIGINLTKLNMKEFKDQIDRLVKKKQRNHHTKNKKKMS